MSRQADRSWQIASAVGRIDGVVPWQDVLAIATPDEILAAARAHKVPDLALANAVTTGTSDHRMSHVRGGLEQEQRIRELSRAAAEPFVRAALKEAAAVGAAVIKGRAVRRWYPNPDLRHTGDIDLQSS